MNKRDVIVGLAVIVVFVGVFLLFKRRKANLQVPQVTPTPTATETIQSKFNMQIPDNVEKAELKDVTGGNASGVATRDTVLADLPDLDNGYFYQVWDELNGKLASLGKMRAVKGGYLFEGNIQGSKVVVSKEKVFDNDLETKILEGSF